MVKKDAAPKKREFQVQPSMFRGIPERVCTAQAEKLRRQNRENRKARERRAQKANR